MARHHRLLLIGLAFACDASSGGPAAGAESTIHTAVVVVEGGPGKALASLLEAHIQAPHSVRPPQPFLAALASRGTPTLSFAIGNRARDAQLVARARSIASEQHVDVAILVAHPKGRRGAPGHLWIIDSFSEAATVDQDLAASTAIDEAEEVWIAASGFFPPPSAPLPQAPKEAPPSAPAAGDTSSPPGATKEGATSKPARASTPSELADHTEATSGAVAPEKLTRIRSMFIAEASLGASSRHVSYVDRITPTLRAYDLFAAPWISVGGEVYPLIHLSMSRWLTGLGATVQYGRAFALASADAGGTRVGTQWQAFDVGVRNTVNVARTVTVGGSLGFGINSFEFDRTSTLTVLPSADYDFVRAGLDGRGQHGDLSFFGSGAYLVVLSTGAMHNAFPRERAGGIEAGLGASYPVASAFELSVGITYTRFFFSMHPQPGDANVAGGALDEMARLCLTLAYLR